MWSPRERGCSRDVVLPVPHARVVPARAGVFRSGACPQAAARCGPRASGGVPFRCVSAGRGPLWSPRERGCSVGAEVAEQVLAVVPARAGVFRRSAPPLRARRRGPRASGGVPRIALPSVMSHPWSPRERGCSEDRLALRDEPSVVPPRERGCSDLHHVAGRREPVVPARAGVFRCGSTPPPARSSGPRASGGVPRRSPRRVGVPRWSPRERGCSVVDDLDVLVAGVVPARERGGVPTPSGSALIPDAWSPRERGCSGRRRPGAARGRVVPARAGVFRWDGLGPERMPSRWSPRERGCSDSGDGSLVQGAMVRARGPGRSARTAHGSGGTPPLARGP